jgi:hypothetical protein
MTYYIGSARHDEKGKYSKGRKGDQTGHEVETQKFYNYPSKGGWICYRAKSEKIANGLKNAMLRACANPNIGYSQSDRYHIMNHGGTRATEPTNTDCSILVRTCILEASGADIGDFTTASEHNALLRSGLFNKIGLVTNLSRLNDGDILVTAKKGHTAIVTSGHPNISQIVKTAQNIATPKNNRNLVAEGQQHSINFTGQHIAVDGSRGPETRKQAVKVVQTALNLDYGARLAVDGSWGPATQRAFGSHYVKKGERQYLVTAAEILCLLNGRNPNGVECPGHFGNGLKAAAGADILKADWFKRMTQ